MLCNLEWSGERSAELVSTSETRNPKPETDCYKVGFDCETRNPKPETDSEDLYPGPTETRNPKSETDSEDLCEAVDSYGSPGPIEIRNPKPETEDLTSPGPIETRNPKPETWNPKPTAKIGFKRRNPKPETWNPKPTAKVGFNRRNRKPETRNRLESDFWVALRIGTPGQVISSSLNNILTFCGFL